MITNENGVALFAVPFFYTTFALEIENRYQLSTINYQLSTINYQLSTIMRPWLNIQLITAFVLSVGGLVMLFCGIYISPLGQIHESLLVAFGEVATFAGAIMGVDYSYRHRGPRKF